MGAMTNRKPMCFFFEKVNAEGDTYYGLDGTDRCDTIEMKCAGCEKYVCRNHQTETPPPIHLVMAHLAEDYQEGPLLPLAEGQETDE